SILRLVADSTTSPCPSPRSRRRGDSGLERQLNLRQVVLRVAFEARARAFDVDCARREGEGEFPLVRVLQNLCVAAAQLIVWAAVHEREAASSWQGAHAHAVHGDF